MLSTTARTFEGTSVNQSLIRQRFRFTDEQLDWITDLLSPMLGRDDQQPWALNVIGAVDGTLVRIRTPAVDGWQYVSRKETSCLNVCIIADAVGRILYVSSGSPGSVHDATVWRHSAPAAAFNSGATVAGYRLLGDMGYANGGGIMTPFRPTAVQGDARKARYNRDHCRMRSIVEMTIGRLKSSFPVLSSELRVGPQRASKIVIACAVLHNVSLCLHATAMGKWEEVGGRRWLILVPTERTSVPTSWRGCSHLSVAGKDVTFRGRCPRRGVVDVFVLMIPESSSS
ncbi:transposase, IS4 family [Teladorsagia circumcincta]|uniref:Transposase, IS4 family n=1 Tax=Teladorsagia circumcincta TaxID=45464 RepID=A0A2G9U8N2_TELCI|nr:transposase, IS4 family [Teladorsagia circumcincta]